MKEKKQSIGIVGVMMLWCMVIVHGSEMLRACNINEKTQQITIEKYKNIYRVLSNRNRASEICIVDAQTQINKDTGKVLCITIGLYNDRAVEMEKEEWKEVVDAHISKADEVDEVTVQVDIWHRSVRGEKMASGVECKEYKESSNKEESTSANVQNTMKENNKNAIHTVMEYIAKRIAYTKMLENTLTVHVMFDYAVVYYCNMPDVVEMLKHTIKSDMIMIEYKVKYNIVYNTYYRKVYRADEDTLYYIRRLCAKNDKRNIVLKSMVEEDGNKKLVQKYMYEKDEEAQSSSNTHRYVLTRISTYEKIEQCVMHIPYINKSRYRWYEKKCNIAVWDMSEIYRMVEIKDNEKIKQIEVDVYHRCTCINTREEKKESRLVINMEVPSKKTLYVKYIEICTDGIRSAVLQGANIVAVDTENKDTQRGMMHAQCIALYEKYRGELLYTSMRNCEYIQAKTLILDCSILHTGFVNTGLEVDDIVLDSNTLYKIHVNRRWNGMLLPVIQKMRYRNTIQIELLKIAEYVKHVIENISIDMHKIVEELAELSGKEEKEIYMIIENRKEVHITITRERMQRRIDKIKAEEEKKSSDAKEEKNDEDVGNDGDAKEEENAKKEK